MTVQELFTKANKQMVFNAYTLIEPLFDDLNTDSLAIQAGKMEIIKNRIFSLCDHICKCQPVQGEKETVFVMEKSNTQYGRSYIKEIEVFTIKDNEALNTIDKDFTIWNDKGEVTLGHYDIGFMPFEEVAAYDIAKESVNTYGIDVCCAAILTEMCFCGTTIEGREERVNEIIEELENSVRNLKPEECIPAEEVFASLEEKYFSEMSDDEKLYRQYKKEFEEKVRDIERRELRRVTDEDHKKYIEIIRTEYNTRKHKELINKSTAFFHDNEDHLIEKYGPHKFLLIYDGNVEGVYDNREEGLETGCKKHLLGTFAVQETAAEPVHINYPMRVSRKRVYDNSIGEFKTKGRMIRAINVKPLENYLLIIRFENEEERVFNCYPLIAEDNLFKKLEDLDEFSKVYIDEMGLVCWDEATDINPYFLYEKSEPVENFML